MRTQALLLAIVLGWIGLAVGQTKPKFCRKFDCPSFTTKSSTDDFDIRSYAETKWLSITERSDSPWPTSKEKRSMFFKLFPYFMGGNRKIRPVKMAVPALFKISRIGNDFDISMMLYLNVTNPPTPLGSEVTIVTKSAGDVYVGAFTSKKMATPEEFDDEVERLDNAITDAGSYDPEVYYRAVYNYPFDKRDKQHEVWFDKL